MKKFKRLTNIILAILHSLFTMLYIETNKNATYTDVTYIRHAIDPNLDKILYTSMVIIGVAIIGVLVYRFYKVKVDYQKIDILVILIFLVHFIYQVILSEGYESAGVAFISSTVMLMFPFVGYIFYLSVIALIEMPIRKGSE